MFGKSDHCLIVGLGNPGKEYRMTRHNIGEMVIRRFAENHAMTFKDEKRLFCEFAKGEVDGKKLTLLFPKTYMNESGKAVRKYLDYFRLTFKDVLVVCDDVDLPFGQLRLRESGSSGGHNGLKSIELHLNTKNYARLRMGIGSKYPTQDLADHVLGKMTSKELDKLSAFIDSGAKVIRRLLTESISKVMSDVNKKIEKLKEEPRKKGPSDEKKALFNEVEE